MIWLDDFLIRSVLAGLLMVAVAAPMGCLMVWQRLAFLADTLGHASVLGVALGLMLSLYPSFGVLMIIGVIMFILRQSSADPVALSESVLAIISHTGLAAGILLLSLSGNTNISLEAVLFGDLLATSKLDLALIAATVAILLLLLKIHWRALVAASISVEIAQAEGIQVHRLQLILYLMIALLVAVMMKVMGVLLIGAMLVIPVNAARLFSRGPEQMLGLSLLYGLLALFSGLMISWQFDLQTGPSIVVMASIWLLLSLALLKLRKTLT
jgi:zinc transport system permease protein